MRAPRFPRRYVGTRRAYPGAHRRELPIVFDPVPVRQMPRQFVSNYRYLYGRTLGKTWHQMNDLRRNPPTEAEMHRPKHRVR